MEALGLAGGTEDGGGDLGLTLGLGDLDLLGVSKEGGASVALEREGGGDVEVAVETDDGSGGEGQTDAGDQRVPVPVVGEEKETNNGGHVLVTTG